MRIDVSDISAVAIARVPRTENSFQTFLCIGAKSPGYKRQICRHATSTPALFESPASPVDRLLSLSGLISERNEEMTGRYLRITALSAIGVFGLATLGTPAFAGKMMTVPKITPPPTVAAVKPVPVPAVTAPAPAPIAAKAPAPAPVAPKAQAPAPVPAKAP